MDNLQESLLLLMEDLHKRSFLTVFIDERCLDGKILPTTWEELKRRYWVRQAIGSRWYYTLSGSGWLTALRILGEFDTAEMRERTGKLCAALKAKVKDRQHEEIIHVSELATDSGLSLDFILDAIESDLIGELFEVRGATWLDRGTHVEIPVDFGHKPL